MATVRPLEVYLVEDALGVRERLKSLLESIEGVHVVGLAERADTAIDEILALRPDVAILDIALAHGTGFDVLRALRERAPAIDSYILSNFSSAAYRERAAELGACDLFDKSFEFEAVRDALKQRVAGLTQAP